MTSMPSRNRSFMQWCWLVRDLDAAMAHWTRTAGVGPFFVFRNAKHDQALYRGQPSETPDMKAAMAYSGDVQIELIELQDSRPSMFLDLPLVGKTSLHHAALYSGNYDADVTAYTSGGAEVAFSGVIMGFRVCWLDTSEELGFMVEIMERNPVADTLFATFRIAALGWNGKDPVRSL